MTFKIVVARLDDAAALADLRAAAMQESLEAIGRFDPQTARSRFTNTYKPSHTKKVFLNRRLVGFFTCWDEADHVWLNHFYIHPRHQGGGLGSRVLALIIEDARAKNLPLRLIALKQSRSNEFYQQNGFVKLKEDEWDNFYELPV